MNRVIFHIFPLTIFKEIKRGNPTQIRVPLINPFSDSNDSVSRRNYLLLREWGKPIKREFEWALELEIFLVSN